MQARDFPPHYSCMWIKIIYKKERRCNWDTHIWMCAVAHQRYHRDVTHLECYAWKKWVCITRCTPAGDLEFKQQSTCTAKCNFWSFLDYKSNDCILTTVQTERKHHIIDGSFCYLNSAIDERKNSIFAAQKTPHPLFLLYHLVLNIMESPACSVRDTQKGHQPILSQFAH